MGTQRKSKLGIKIKQGAELYSYRTEKYFKLDSDIFIPKDDIMEQVGHFRFNHDLGKLKTRQRFAYTYNSNRGKYETIYKN